MPKVTVGNTEEHTTYETSSTEHCVLITVAEAGHVRDYDDLVNDPEVIITMKEVHWNTVTGACEILVFYERVKKVPTNQEKMRRLEEVLND